MAFAYRISSSGDQVRIVGTGKITTAQCIRIVDRVMSDPRRHLDATALVDLHKATYKPADLAEVIDIAEELLKFRSGLKATIAIVARRSTLFPSAILSAYLRRAAKVGIRVFVDLAAAEAYCRGNWHPAHGA